MRYPPILLMALMALCLGGFGLAPAQPPMSMPDEGSAQASMDSLRREITKRILSDAEKKDIRACEREKSQFLKQCRTADTAHAGVDRRLNDAKLQSANPNDPAIQALLERKFTLEKGCDDKYSATARGKQCLSGEQKRQAALEKALAKDKGYQALKQRAEAVGAEHL
jgi:hypothetical protein